MYLSPVPPPLAREGGMRVACWCGRIPPLPFWKRGARGRARRSYRPVIGMYTLWAAAGRAATVTGPYSFTAPPVSISCSQ